MESYTGVGNSWSDLPRELVEKISKRLDTETDILRFRAVCSSWRSSTTSFKKSPCESIKLPYPFMYYKPNSEYFTLVERTLYRLELPDPQDTNFWMVKLQRMSNGKMRIINPSRRVNNTAGTLNTLHFRIFEVCKSYALDHANPDQVLDFDEYKCTKKIVFSKNDDDGYCVMAIDGENKLWYIKSGDDRWTLVPRNGGSNYYDGIVNLKGRFYGVDDWGCIWEFDSNFNSTRFSNDILV